MGKRLERARALVSRVPIYGQLFYSSKDSFVAAAKELLLATVFSLFPIWFYPLALWFFGVPFWGTLESFVVQGELYLISAALLGPLVYATTKTYGQAGSDDRSNGSDSEAQGFPRIWSLQFPHGASFSVTSILVCCLAAILFGILRVSEHATVGPGSHEEATLVTSTLLYAFTLSCMFCVLVYRSNLERVPERFGADERELRQQWRERD